jgi:hypothetical protein
LRRNEIYEEEETKSEQQLFKSKVDASLKQKQLLDVDLTDSQDDE